MRLRTLSRCLLLVPALLCLADSLPRLSLEGLVAQSEVIVAGRIERAWTAMDSENKFLWTHYRIQIRTTLKGAPLSSVVVSEPGGDRDGVTLYVPGATHYAVGDEVSVFLYRTPIGYLRTANYGQGKFTISADRRVHANRAMDLAGAVVSPRVAQSPGPVSADNLDGLDWSQFEARVRKQVQVQAERR
jgi:hypothetical protein